MRKYHPNECPNCKHVGTNSKFIDVKCKNTYFKGETDRKCPDYKPREGEK